MMVEPLFRVTIDYSYALKQPDLCFISFAARNARLPHFTFKDLKDRDISHSNFSFLLSEFVNHLRVLLDRLVRR